MPAVETEVATTTTEEICRFAEGNSEICGTSKPRR